MLLNAQYYSFTLVNPCKMFMLQRDQLCTELRNRAGVMYHTADAELIPVAGHSIPILQRLYEEIQQVSDEISQLRSEVTLTTAQVEHADGAEAERLLQKLNISGELVISQTADHLDGVPLAYTFRL